MLYVLIIYLYQYRYLFINIQELDLACEHHFRAANQSSIKSKNLDDTGIFGCTCRHGIPLNFLNLKEIGER